MLDTRSRRNTGSVFAVYDSSHPLPPAEQFPVLWDLLHGGKRICQQNLYNPILEQRTVKYRLVAKSDPPLVLINKVLLEHNNARSHVHRLWLRACGSGQLEQLEQRPCGLQRLKYLLSGHLLGKRNCQLLTLSNKTTFLRFPDDRQLSGFSQEDLGFMVRGEVWELVFVIHAWDSCCAASAAAAALASPGDFRSAESGQPRTAESGSAFHTAACFGMHTYV